MSALTDAILQEIETLQEDIVKARGNGDDASHFETRLKDLTQRLNEANASLAGKPLLKS